MSYRISQTDPETMTTEDLLTEIGSFKTLAAEVIERLSLILVTLRARRQPHPFFQDRILAFYRQIADQSLHPEAAILLANRNTIRAVLPLPRDRQVAIAQGEPIPVAERTDAGEIRSDDLPIHRMDERMLKRAFGPDGIRPVHEQAELLRKEGRIERHGMITVDRDRGQLKIGNQRFAPEEMEAALLALGYRLVLAREAV